MICAICGAELWEDGVPADGTVTTCRCCQRYLTEVEVLNGLCFPCRSKHRGDELQAAREVVEAARKVAYRGPVYVSELRDAFERYDGVRGGED